MWGKFASCDDSTFESTVRETRPRRKRSEIAPRGQDAANATETCNGDGPRLLLRLTHEYGTLYHRYPLYHNIRLSQLWRRKGLQTNVYFSRDVAAAGLSRPTKATARTTISFSASSNHASAARGGASTMTAAASGASASKDSPAAAVGAVSTPGNEASGPAAGKIVSSESAGAGVSEARQAAPVSGTRIAAGGPKKTPSSMATATAAAAATEDAADATVGETRIVYVVPEQTPPAVRLVLGRRTGWTEWNPEVHGADEVSCKFSVNIAKILLCRVLISSAREARRNLRCGAFVLLCSSSLHDNFSWHIVPSTHCMPPLHGSALGSKDSAICCGLAINGRRGELPSSRTLCSRHRRTLVYQM